MNNPTRDWLNQESKTTVTCNWPISSSGQFECFVDAASIKCTLESEGIIDKDGKLDKQKLEVYEDLLLFNANANSLRNANGKKPSDREILMALMDPANAICIRNKAAALALKCGLETRSAEPDECPNDEC